MDLQLYNTLTRRKEIFKPLQSGRVGMYVCGPTVYSYAHIGNARSAVVFDLLYRLLRHLYPQVDYIRNITDIDDKISAAALEEQVPIAAIARRYEEAYHQDMAALNLLPPTREPRVTEHLAEIIAMIERLLAAGAAYEAEGHLLFHVPAFKGYGALSGRNVEELLAGARIEPAPYKKDPCDFVLWKPSTTEQPGWSSPWGRGRPGWHIECSAMVEKYFGATVDIHGGGQDLLFPHHENECAQSACAHEGRPLSRYWLHNGFIRIGREKMSKSLGNVLLTRDLLEKAPGEALRLALISAHYRSSVEWSDRLLLQAIENLNRFYECLQRLAAVEVVDLRRYSLPRQFEEALKDDINSAVALAQVHALVREANRASSLAQQKEFKGQLLLCGNMLGILQYSPQEWFQRPTTIQSISPQHIEDLLAKRAAARQRGDYAQADSIREELKGYGISVKDSAEGTEWKREARLRLSSLFMTAMLLFLPCQELPGQQEDLQQEQRQEEQQQKQEGQKQEQQEQKEREQKKEQNGEEPPRSAVPGTIDRQGDSKAEQASNAVSNVARIRSYRLALDPGHGGAALKRRDDRWDPVTKKYLSFYNYGSRHKGYEEHRLVLALSKRLKRYLDLTTTPAGWKDFEKLLRRFSSQKSFPPLRLEVHITRYDNWKKRGLGANHSEVNAPYRLFDFPASAQKASAKSASKKSSKKNSLLPGRLSRINQHRPYLVVSLHMTKAGSSQPGGMAAVLAPGYRTLNTLRLISLGKLPRSRFQRIDWHRHWLVTEKGWSRYETAWSDAWVYFNGRRTYRARLKHWKSYNRGLRHNFITWRYADRPGWERLARRQQRSAYRTDYRRFQPKGSFWERERGEPEQWRREGGALGFGGDNHYASDELMRFVQFGVPLLDPAMRSKGAIAPIQSPFVSTYALPIYTNAVAAMLEIGYINRWKDRRLLTSKLDQTAISLAAGIYSLFHGLKLRKGSAALRPRGRQIDWERYEKRPDGNYFDLAGSPKR